jgi:hypothetical protein
MDPPLAEHHRRLAYAAKVNALINRAGAKVRVVPSKSRHVFYVYSGEEGHTDRLLAAATSEKTLGELLRENQWATTKKEIP